MPGDADQWYAHVDDRSDDESAADGDRPPNEEDEEGGPAVRCSTWDLGPGDRVRDLEGRGDGVTPAGHIDPNHRELPSEESAGAAFAIVHSFMMKHSAYHFGRFASADELLVN